MKEQRRQREVQFRKQRKSEWSKKRLERKERKEQEIYSIKTEKISKKHKNKELDLILRTKNEELREAKRKQFQEAQAIMKQFSNKKLTSIKQTAPKNKDDIEMAEKVLHEEFTIGEPSNLKFSVFSSVYYSHNFYRKCENRDRVLCYWGLY